jgi:hypothetical protein
MSLFRSDEDIETWRRASGEPRGEALPLEQVWALAQAWYASRMDPAFRGRTPAGAEEVFTSVGLVSDFWRI